MSSGYALKDFQDLWEAVMRELKIPTTDEVELERVKEDLNDILINEVVPAKRWLWRAGRTDVQFKPYYADGTASVTPDSTTVTLSTAPSVSRGSFKGYKFAVDQFDEVYTISAHTAGSTTVTLSSAYTSTLNTEANFKIWTDRIILPTDCSETVEVWHDFSKRPVEPLGLQEFRRRVAEGPRIQARPVYYTTYDYEDPTADTDELESDRYRIMLLYPAVYDNSTTIHVEYTKEVEAMELAGDEPPMPIEDRIVLVYGARSLAWRRHRNEEAAELNWQRFQAKLARMMGKTEDSFDKPQITPDSKYMAHKRGGRIKGVGRASASSGGGSSYTAPSYLEGATINGATVTGNITVASGITIDGRDLSADGTALDGHIAASSGAHAASAISNTPSGNLAASTVQGALNELQTDIDSRALDSDLDAHIADTTDAHAASAITNTPSGNLAATTVQGAVNELQGDIDAHLADTTDAHAASAITNTPSGNLAATTVQGALNELQTDVDTRATTTALNDHISDATDAHAASAITNTPSGNLAATTVQGALNELQTDVDARQARATLTAKGSIYVATASATVAEQAVGSDGQVLTADSSQTNGIKWASVGALAIATKTAAYTATNTDDLILCDASGGAFTITLFAASGNTGKVLRIKKTDTSFNAVTIDGNAAETIDGATTTTLNTKGEMLIIVCDGSNWIIVERIIPSTSTSFTPTGSWSTNTTYTGHWRRLGDSVEVVNNLSLAGAPTSASLDINLPSGLSIDTTKLTTGDASEPVGGEVQIFDSGVAGYSGQALYIGTATSLRVAYFNVSGSLISGTSVTQTGPMTFAAGDAIWIRYRVPISGWNG